MNTATQERLYDMESVKAFCVENNFPADVVGKWVWIKFESKPPAHERELLKGAGFRWVKRRGEWAHNCGVPSTKGSCNPRWKYGAYSIKGPGAPNEDGCCSPDFVGEFEYQLQQNPDR